MKTQEIADLLGAELVGDGDIEVIGLASAVNAGPGDLTFIIERDGTASSNASCVIVPLGISTPPATNYVAVADPKLAFTIAADEIRSKHPIFGPGKYQAISDSANIQTKNIGSFVSVGDNASIGKNAAIGDGVKIGQNVKVGDSTVIYPNCVVYDYAEIGSGCVIHAGTVIGSDGFGYVRGTDGEHRQFPQAGKLVIEDNVEIGANCTIDRGSLGETRIGAGTKLDNMVHIAHNVNVGKRVLIAGQSGIAGSSNVEDDVVIAGQVGIADHVTIKAGAMIGAKSSVFPNKVIGKGVWAGIPVEKIDDYKRQIAMVRGLARTRKELADLRSKLSALDNDQH